MRGNWSIFNGSLSLYHADVRDELLGVKLHPTDISATYFNASPTTHQGVELGLDTTLWRAAGSTTDAPNAIVFRQNYTYTDLHYDHDALLGHNQLPGIPPNFYEAELRYTHPSGVYAGVNTQYSSGYYVDYANTYKNNAFVVLGAKVGYSPSGGHWDTYLQAKNLTNAHYAASILTQYDLHGKDGDLVFVPGDGFGVFGGVTFHM